MATFSYRCPVDGPFDLRLPVGAATARAECPRCGTDASRVFTVPMIATGSRKHAALIERCERTASEPDVVTSPAARPRPARSGTAAHNPAWAKLPRP